MSPFAREGTFYRLVRECHADRIESPGSSLIFGARFNPPASFETLYLSSSEQGCMDEIKFRAGGDLRRLKPLVLGTFKVRLSKVLDLTDPHIQDIFLKRQKIKLGELKSPGEHRLTQRLGSVTRKRGFEAVLFYSAVSRAGQNLAIFLDRLGPNSFVQKASTRVLELAALLSKDGRRSPSVEPKSVWTKFHQLV